MFPMSFKAGKIGLLSKLVYDGHQVLLTAGAFKWLDMILIHPVFHSIRVIAQCLDSQNMDKS